MSYLLCSLPSKTMKELNLHIKYAVVDGTLSVVPVIGLSLQTIVYACNSYMTITTYKKVSLFCQFDPYM